MNNQEDALNVYFVCKDCSIPMNKAQEDAQTCTSFVKIVMKHV